MKVYQVYCMNSQFTNFPAILSVIGGKMFCEGIRVENSTQKIRGEAQETWKRKKKERHIYIGSFLLLICYFIF